MVKNTFTWFEFDYDPTTAIQDIQLNGALPHQKTHQFYPTTEALAAQLLDEVDIRESETCLEPSAGMGGLADLMPKEQTTCVEISPLHCRLLEAKDHNVIEGDFLQWAQETRERFDVVVMNPPYSEGRALAHLDAAAALVKKKQEADWVRFCLQGAKKKHCCRGGVVTGRNRWKECLQEPAFVWCVWWRTNQNSGQKKGRVKPCQIPPLHSTTKSGPRRNIDCRTGNQRVY